MILRAGCNFQRPLTELSLDWLYTFWLIIYLHKVVHSAFFYLILSACEGFVLEVFLEKDAICLSLHAYLLQKNYYLISSTFFIPRIPMLRLTQLKGQ